MPEKVESCDALGLCEGSAGESFLLFTSAAGNLDSVVLCEGNGGSNDGLKHTGFFLFLRIQDVDNIIGVWCGKVAVRFSLRCSGLEHCSCG